MKRYISPILLLLFCPAWTALGQTPGYQILYNFCSQANCADGSFPMAGLVRDSAGNLYGTTAAGGNSNALCGATELYDDSNPAGCGTVFKLDTAGNYFVLYKFCSQPNCTDGANPFAGLTIDADGNLYGTTREGGNTALTADWGAGFGTVFKLDSAGNYSVLHTFCATATCTDGGYPWSDLVTDPQGNLYGTVWAYGGGIFELNSAGQLTMFDSTVAQCDGAEQPIAGVIRDAAGNLYGTTVTDETFNGYGTAFKMNAAGSCVVLHAFCSSGGESCTDGAAPAGALLPDRAGNLYGTTTGGGAPNPYLACVYGGYGSGTLFKIDTSSSETVLHSFCSGLNCEDGGLPYAGLIEDAAGNFYGTTACGGNSQYVGTIFELDNAGREAVLHSFGTNTSSADGLVPMAGLVEDSAGNLYGTTAYGGAYGGGAVFELSTTALPVIGLGSYQLDFGNILVGVTTPTTTVTLTNIGAVNLTISSDTITGTNASDFRLSSDNCAGSTIPPSGTCTFAVAFAPSEAIIENAAVTVTGNATNSPLSIVLNGAGSSGTPASTPTFSVPAGTYPPGLIVTLSDATLGATIYYTTNGTVPTTNSPQFTGMQIIVNSTMTIEAMATALTYAESAVATATYTIVSGPIAGVSPSSLTFGSQATGTTSFPQSVTLSNTGSAALAVAGITTSGDFSQINNCGSGVNPGGYCTISVNFSPTAAGTRTGTLSITDNNNSGSGSTQTVSLTGTGTGATSAPVAGVSPSSLSFAATMVNSTTAAQAVTLSNTGNAALSVAGITINGDFSQTNNCGGSVAAGGSCAISVTFTPTASGSRTGTLTITDNNNGVSGSTQTVGLTGTGAASAPAAGVSPSSLSFAATMVNSSTNSQAVTLSNTGSAALTMAGIAASANFAQTNNCGSSVAAGGSCTINVTFSPTKGGSLTGTVIITDNSNNTTGSTQTVTLSGTGEDYTLTLPSGSSSSASVNPGQSATYTLAVGSEGGLSQSVNFSCTDPASESTCTVSPNPGMPGSNITVTVSTTAGSTLAPRILPPPRLPGSLTVLALALLLASAAWAVRARREVEPSRRRRVFVPLAAGLLFALALAGCGGGGSSSSSPPPNQGTPAGTYNLTVTGTVGSGSTAVSHSMTLTLTVS